MSDKTKADAGSALGLCSGCGYFPDYLNSHRCTPGDACIRAHSGRQIDRFLRANPDEAHSTWPTSSGSAGPSRSATPRKN
jgi:hypothetical protein